MGRIGKEEKIIIFSGLVENAIDFFEKSIDALENSPKYSLIYFCTAVELFFKARLLKEHWALLYIRPEKACVDSFNDGDFTSVGIEECITRLKKISNLKIDEKEQKSYGKLRKHRNIIIHFYHKKYDGTDKEVLYEIVSEQLAAWYYLHVRLTKKWKKPFSKYSKEIRKLHRRMLKNKEYLVAKYNELEEKIKSEMGNGVKFVECDICQLRAAKILYELTSEENDTVRCCRCLVCTRSYEILHVECPQCKNIFHVQDELETCPHCKNEIAIEDVIEKYKKHFDPKEPDEGIAYCGGCEHYEPSVVPFGDEYVCLRCLCDFENLERCDFCRSHLKNGCA